MTAATELWTKPEDLTDAQKALTVVARWKYIEVMPDDSMRAVDEVTGVLGNLTAFAVTFQGIQIGDVSEVREGPTREEDVVVIYRKERFTDQPG